MIKNEKQYRITKAQVRRFEQALSEMDQETRPANISPKLWQARRAGAEAQLKDLQAEVGEYEKLHVARVKDLVLTAVEDLPKTLIRARIASGMTQEGLAHRLGVKTQQVQRYEATDYESASFARIVKVVHALGLKLPKPARLVRER